MEITRVRYENTIIIVQIQIRGRKIRLSRFFEVPGKVLQMGIHSLIIIKWSCYVPGSRLKSLPLPSGIFRMVL